MDNEILKVYRADDKQSITHHFHNGYEMIFIEEGRAEFIINGVKKCYGRNDIIFISQLEQHRMRPLTDTYVRYVVFVDPDYFDRFVGDQVLCSIFKQRPENFENGFPVSPEKARYIADILQRCAQEYKQKERYAELCILSHILSLLIYLYRTVPERFPSASSNHLTATAVRIQNYIDKHFLEDLSLEALSGHFHLNAFYIMEVFRDVIGYTVKQYTVLKRISHAKNLLYYSDKEISQVAIESGFNSASNFIRAFKKHEGVTPLRFRKAIAEN